MAFTKAPTQDTYSSVRLKPFYDIDMRPNGFSLTSTRKDAGTVNLIPIGNTGDDIVAQLRLPFLGVEVASSTDNVRGVFVWNYENAGIAGTRYYVAAGNKVYSSGDGFSWSTLITWTRAAGYLEPVGFCEFINSSGQESLVIVDGLEGYVSAAATPTSATKITDVDFPSPHTPYPVFIDGYLFLSKENTGDIYNSDLDNPANWTAGNFISSEVYPDAIKAIAKVNNYLLAIGSSGCEYFYDAANATGSPLARQEGAVLPFGCVAVKTMAVNKNRVVFLANMNDGEAALVAIEDFKYKDITPPWLTSLLMKVNSGDHNQTWGYFVRQYGVLLYCLNIGYGNYGTYFYDFNHTVWGELLHGNMVQVRYTAFATRDKAVTFFCSDGLVDSSNVVFGYMSNASIISGTFSSDGEDSVRKLDGSLSSTQIAGVIRTPPIDFGTYNYKTMSRLSFEVEFTKDNASSFATIKCYDSDWESSPSVDRGLNYTTENNFITQLGGFRRRSIQISLPTSSGYDKSSFRIRSIEVDINKGQQ